MNLELEIRREHSKRQTIRVARWVGNDKRRFRQLMELFLKGEYRVTQRSARVIGRCGENYPELIPPYLTKMVKRMQEPGVHDAVKRNVLHVLQFVEIPKKLLGEVATICFDYLNSPDEPIAIKVFSMSVLGNIARKEPDLKNELRLVIERQLPYGSAGFRSRAKRVMKKIEV